MSIVTDQTREFYASLSEWCGTVRVLFAEHGDPITSIEDYRVQQFIDATENDTFPSIERTNLLIAIHDNPAYAARMYFERCISLPTPPHGSPLWASTHRFSIDEWPIVHFTFKSEHITLGGVEAYAERSVSVAVADRLAAESSNPFVGDVAEGTIRQDANATDVTLLIDGHPVDFYGASNRTIQQAAAALLSISTKLKEASE